MLRNRVFTIVAYGLCLCGLCIGLLKLFDISKEYKSASKGYKQLKMLMDESEIEEGAEERLREINQDYIAWLRIEGTSVDYPVVMESDRDYLSTGFYGEESRSGTPFVRRIQDVFADENTIIYAHNMRDGSMFAPLKKYLEQKYYELHPSITIWYQGKKKEYQIYSVRVLEGTDGSVYQYSFPDETSYREYLDLMVKRSVVKGLERPDTTKKILTLSTCYGKDKKIVVQAVEKEPIV